MSLMRIALRMCAVMALKGRTLAGDNVLDSEIGALSDERGSLRVNQKSRFIAIYTDEAEEKPDAQRPFHGNGMVNLCIEFGVTDAMVVTETDPDDPDREIETVVPGIPYTVGKSELYLDLLSRQIRNCLSEGSNEAAEAFRSLFLSVAKVKCERAGSSREGERVAAQRLTFSLETLPDPLVKTDLVNGSGFHKFLTLLEAGDGKEQRHATLFRDAIPDPVNETEDTRKRSGLTFEEFAALGFADFPGADETSKISNVTVEVSGAAPVEVSS